MLALLGLSFPLGNKYDITIGNPFVLELKKEKEKIHLLSRKQLDKELKL